MASEIPQPASVLPGPSTRGQWAMLGGVVLLAALLRLLFIGATEPDFDELWHLEISTGRGSLHATLPMNQIVDAPAATSMSGAAPWYRIPALQTDDAHPPLYYLLLRAWRAIFGESMLAARMLSALLSTLCIVALFDAMRQIHPVASALWASLILALSSSQIELGQEVRSYSMLVLFALLAAAALLRIEQLGLNRRRAITFFIALLAGVFTHYFLLPAATAMGVYALLRLRGPSRRVVVGSILVAYAIFALSWTPMLLRQRQVVAEATTEGALLDTSEHPVRQSFLRASATPVRQLFEPKDLGAGTALLSGTLFVLPWLLLRIHPKLLFWAIWLVLIVGFALGLDLARSTLHLSQVRHTILAGPAVCAIIAMLMLGQRPLLAHGLPALVCVACFAALGLTYDRENIEFSKLADDLSDARGSEAPLVFYSDADRRFWSQWTFLAAAHYTGLFPRAVARLDHPADSQLVQQLKRFPRVWLVSGMTKLTAHEILPGCQVESAQFEFGVGTIRELSWPGQGDRTP